MNTTNIIYKILVEDREFKSWSIYETKQFQKIELTIDPIKEKLFSDDTFTIDENGHAKLVHSTLRSGPPIPGVLIIHGNKTYGRLKDKLLYKCIPDDNRIPSFLIPYEIKNIGFSKVFTNLYVTFHFAEWHDKHPQGILNNVIGPVNVLDNFYEYQLYCKCLNTSIQQFQKDTSKALKNKTHENFISNILEKHPTIQDRTNQNDWYIFTIDPPKTTDLDDGFSIKRTDDETIQLSIYISNVTIWMDTLELWDSFSRRISTIYLPDRKRPMLPSILSDSLCSLIENCKRFAFVMDIFIKDNQVINTKYSNCIINVSKNYSYENDDLLINEHYNSLFSVTKDISKNHKFMSNIRTSHDVVSYLMVFMNYFTSQEMIKYNNGIFRSTLIKNEVNIPDNVPDEVSKFIKIWKTSSGQYIDITQLTNDKLRHDLLDLDSYIHITSPIRRLVDLLNIIQFQNNTGLIHLTSKATDFYKKWLNDLSYINTTMRSIRKIQVDCTLLDLCSNDPSVMEKEFDGYLFDKVQRNDGLYQFVVFLPELKLSSRINLRENIDNYENRKFNLFLFNDEQHFKKKIRLHLIQ